MSLKPKDPRAAASRNSGERTMMIEAPTARPVKQVPVSTERVRVGPPPARTGEKGPQPRADKPPLAPERSPSTDRVVAAERAQAEARAEKERQAAERAERERLDRTPQERTAPRSWKKVDLGYGLEKVSRIQQELVKRLEWMLPTVTSTGEVSESVAARLKELLEGDVSLQAEQVQLVSPKNLKRYIADPTFLGVLAPHPNKTRGLLEVELSLAHGVLDTLLGGAGEAVALRPLTDIEEGVLTYVVLETLKVLTPSLDPTMPKLRLEGVSSSVDEAAGLLGDEPNMAMVPLRAQFGTHSGHVRLFIPQSVLATVNPASDSAIRQGRRATDAKAHARRLSGVKTTMRAEIGQVLISSADLAQLRERDVVLVDQLSARPDKGEGGTAQLKIGNGLTGYFEAAVALEGGRFKATIGALKVGEEPLQAQAEGEAAAEGAAPAGDAAPAIGEGLEESTNPAASGGKASVAENNPEGAELLNDIPLNMTVELGRVPITAEEVVQLKAGQVIDLGRVVGEPLDLSVGGKIVARGELVEIEGNLGVRVIELRG